MSSRLLRVNDCVLTLMQGLAVLEELKTGIVPPGTTFPDYSAHESAHFGTQFVELTRRFFKATVRDTATLRSRMFSLTIIALILGTL